MRTALLFAAAGVLASCATSDVQEPDLAVPAFRVRASEKPAPPRAADDGPLVLSIEQAVVLTLEHNRDLRVEELNPVIAGTFEAIERGVFDLEVFADLEFNDERAEETSRSTGEKFSVEASDRSIAAGVRKRLPAGTTVTGTIEQNREDSNRAPGQQQARIGLDVTQSLLRGRGTEVNLARVRQAALDAEASAHELRRFVEVLVAETQIAYWNFVLAREEIGIFERSLAVARRQLDEIGERIKVGVLPRTEAAAARSEVALRNQALIRARHELEDRRLRLLRLVSPDRNGALARALEATSAPAIEPEPIADVADRVELGLRARPDLAEARVRMEQGTLETVVTRDGLLPQLDAFVSVSTLGFGSDFGDSVGNLAGKTYEFTVGLRLRQFVGRRAARARNRAAYATREQSRRALANLEQVVRLEVRLAANAVESARQQIDAARTTRRLQEETVAAEQERFDVGSSTAIIVAQARRDLLAARITEIESVVAYRLARIALHLADGSLLERHGIVLDARGRP